MLCAESLEDEDVVRAGEARAVIGLGIGIVGSLQAGLGGAKFGSGGSREPGARFEAWVESGIRRGPHWQGGVVRSHGRSLMGRG